MYNYENVNTVVNTCDINSSIFIVMNHDNIIPDIPNIYPYTVSNVFGISCLLLRLSRTYLDSDANGVVGVECSRYNLTVSCTPIKIKIKNA